MKMDVSSLFTLINVFVIAFGVVYAIYLHDNS